MIEAFSLNPKRSSKRRRTIPPTPPTHEDELTGTTQPNCGKRKSYTGNADSALLKHLAHNALDQVDVNGTQHSRRLKCRLAVLAAKQHAERGEMEPLGDTVKELPDMTPDLTIQLRPQYFTLNDNHRQLRYNRKNRAFLESIDNLILPPELRCGWCSRQQDGCLLVVCRDFRYVKQSSDAPKERRLLLWPTTEFVAQVSTDICDAMHTQGLQMTDSGCEEQTLELEAALIHHCAPYSDACFEPDVNVTRIMNYLNYNARKFAAYDDLYDYGHCPPDTSGLPEMAPAIPQIAIPVYQDKHNQVKRKGAKFKARSYTNQPVGLQNTAGMDVDTKHGISEEEIERLSHSCQTIVTLAPQFKAKREHKVSMLKEPTKHQQLMQKQQVSVEPSSNPAIVIASESNIDIPARRTLRFQKETRDGTRPEKTRQISQLDTYRGNAGVFEALIRSNTSTDGTVVSHRCTIGPQPAAKLFSSQFKVTFQREGHQCVYDSALGPANQPATPTKKADQSNGGCSQDGEAKPVVKGKPQHQAMQKNAQQPGAQLPSRTSGNSSGQATHQQKRSGMMPVNSSPRSASAHHVSRTSTTNTAMTQAQAQQYQQQQQQQQQQRAAVATAHSAAAQATKSQDEIGHQSAQHLWVFVHQHASLKARLQLLMNQQHQLAAARQEIYNELKKCTHPPQQQALHQRQQEYKLQQMKSMSELARHVHAYAQQQQAAGKLPNAAEVLAHCVTVIQLMATPQAQSRENVRPTNQAMMHQASNGQPAPVSRAQGHPHTVASQVHSQVQNQVSGQNIRPTSTVSDTVAPRAAQPQDLLQPVTPREGMAQTQVPQQQVLLAAQGHVTAAQKQAQQQSVNHVASQQAAAVVKQLSAQQQAVVQQKAATQQQQVAAQQQAAVAQQQAAVARQQAAVAQQQAAAQQAAVARQQAAVAQQQAGTQQQAAQQQAVARQQAMAQQQAVAQHQAAARQQVAVQPHAAAQSQAATQQQMVAQQQAAAQPQAQQQLSHQTLPQPITKVPQVTTQLPKQLSAEAAAQSTKK